MAPVRISIVQRDTTSPDPPKLDTGVIIGIACGIGALFLGSFVLFFIYWRRTRQCELEDTYEPHDLEENPFAASSPPAFTLDYKQPDEKHATASYPVSPSLLRTDTRRLSPVGGLVSAMPTHPAYVPRTVIRGSTPKPSRTLTPTTEEPENLTPRSQTALLPTAPPPARARSKSRPADAVVQAYLYAAEGERVPSSLFRHATADSSRDSSPVPPRSNSSQSSTTRALPLRTTSLPRPQLQITTTTRTRPPRSPPRLNLEMGLERRRPIAVRDPPPPPPPPAGRSITKPLAVLPLEMQQQQQQQQPPAPPPQQQSYYYPEPVEDEPPSEDHRAFRDRADMVIAAVEAPGAGRRQYHHHRRESSSTSRRIGDWIANSSRGQQLPLPQPPPPPPSAGDGQLWS